MEIIQIKTSQLIPYENNPRQNKDAVPAVMKSIQEFGFKVPIVIDKNNVIVAGHTRVMAAQKLGMDSVPCIIADDLTDEQIRAFRLADNKPQKRELADNERAQYAGKDRKRSVSHLRFLRADNLYRPNQSRDCELLLG